MLALSLCSYHCEVPVLWPSAAASFIQQLMSLSFFMFTEEEAADAMETMETKYTDIIIYACGFLALIMAIIIVVLCRMQVHPRREPFDALPVQKLSKFPLRRQVKDSVYHGMTVVASSQL